MIETKKELLVRVIGNTHKLKELKAVLDSFEQTAYDHPFLTL